MNVLIGRFQTPILTNAHKELIQKTINDSNSLIVVGEAQVIYTKTNPFPYEYIKKLITSFLISGDVDSTNTPYIEKLQDNPSDDIWSKNLDKIIDKTLKKFKDKKVIIYHGRDSFKDYYNGKYKKCLKEIKVSLENTNDSATENRIKKYKPNDLYLKPYMFGMLESINNKFDTAFPCIDTCLVSKDHQYIVLGQKNHDPKGQYRFIGGFVDPIKDNSIEDTVVREVKEEIGIDIDKKDIFYISSSKINDSRYRRGNDKIFSSFFISFVDTQKLLDFVKQSKNKGNDDLAKIKCFKMNKLKTSNILDGHRVLYKTLKEYIK